MMWDLLSLGVIITLEPVPLVGFILILSSRRGAVKGATYLAGWVASLAGMIIATLAVTGGHPPRVHSAPGKAIAISSIALGMLLIATSIWVRHDMAAKDRPPRGEPRWTSRLDDMSLWATSGLGFLLQPWPLVIAGATLVSQADVSSAVSVVSLFLFCVISTASILAMEIYVLLNQRSATENLSVFRRWLERNREPVFAALALIAGIYLIGKGSYQFSQ